jgi:hypothetical protein
LIHIRSVPHATRLNRLHVDGDCGVFIKSIGSVAILDSLPEREILSSDTSSPSLPVMSAFINGILIECKTTDSREFISRNVTDAHASLNCVTNPAGDIMLIIPRMRRGGLLSFRRMYR